MPANGVARGRQGRTPQFLTLGLLVVICILAFNYWNVSSRSRLLQRQVQEMTATLEELAMKKVHLEKRSEALQSQIGDANKINTLLKTDKETCAQERDQINLGKNELLTQLSRLGKEKEAAVLSLEQFRKNASHSIELLMELKTKYATLRADHQRIEEASRIEASKQDQTIVELQQQQRTAYMQVQQCNSIMSELKNQVALLQAANQKCSATLQLPADQQPADQQPGNNMVQPIVNQQNEMSPQQIDTARGNQPQRFAQQAYWQQKQQDYIRQQEQQREQDYARQQKERQQQQDQRGHLLYGLTNQQANNKEEHEGDELEQPVNKQQDPGPVQMEANADDNHGPQQQQQQQQQMFPDREQQQEAGNEQQMVDLHKVEVPQQYLAEQGDQNRGRNDQHGYENEDHRNIDEEQVQGQQGQEQREQEDEQEESDLSDVDVKGDQIAEDRDKDIDEGQVQAPAENEDLGNDEEKVGNVRVVDEENVNDNQDFREGALHAPRVEDTRLN